MDRLKFVIPETGHEFAGEFMETFPVGLNAAEAVLGLAEMFTKAELGVALGVVFPIVSAVIGQWFSLGSGYAAARAAIAKDNMASGFSRGAVLGAERAPKPELLKDYFWKFSPDPNPVDEDAGKIAQTAYNQGLVAGFMQGRELSKAQREWFWKDIGRRVGDQSARGAPDTWSRKEWVDWYILAAAKFRGAHLT